MGEGCLLLDLKAPLVLSKSSLRGACVALSITIFGYVSLRVRLF
jgi:hypothetical protein